MNPTDAGPFISILLTFMPPGAATYVGWAVGILSMLCSASSLFVAFCQPPHAGSAAWWLNAYKVAAWPALNFRWATNAVVPGMPAAVREAALQSAKLAAAAPELTRVTQSPAIAGTITPAPTLPDDDGVILIQKTPKV